MFEITEYKARIFHTLISLFDSTFCKKVHMTRKCHKSQSTAPRVFINHSPMSVATKAKIYSEDKNLLENYSVYCKFGNFREDLIFEKLRICEVS